MCLALCSIIAASGLLGGNVLGFWPFTLIVKTTWENSAKGAEVCATPTSPTKFCVVPSQEPPRAGPNLPNPILCRSPVLPPHFSFAPLTVNRYIGCNLSLCEAMHGQVKFRVQYGVAFEISLPTKVGSMRSPRGLRGHAAIVSDPGQKKLEGCVFSEGDSF